MAAAEHSRPRCSRALALGAGIGGWLSDRRKAAEPSYRLVLAAPAETRLLEGQPPAISPDGRTIAFAVREGPRTGIYLQRLDSFEPIPVKGAERGERPFFSPDGQWLGFIVESRLFKLPIGGGKPTLLLEAGVWEVTAHWHRDDEIVLGGNEDVHRRGLSRVAADGSGSGALTTIDPKRKEQLHGWPQVLEDGSILVGVQTEERRRVARYFPQGERLEYLPIDAEPPAFYLPGGRLVYQARSSVWVAPYDLGRGVVGDPVELLSGVGNDEWAVSPSGVLAYLFARSRGRRVVAVDRQGRALVLVEEEREYNWPRIAPDGRRFAVGHDAPEGAGLWIYELGSGRRLQLQAPGGNGEPTWTPDGRRVAYSTTRTEGGHLHWQLADGSGVSELLHAGTFAQWPTSFSPDGRAIAFYGADGEDPEDSIWIATLPTDGRGEASARRAIGGPGTQRAGAFSPDGRWLAYSSSESGESQIYVRPYPDLASRRFVVSEQGGVDPHWSSDSREIFYRNGDATYVVGVTPSSEPVVGAPRELFRGRFHFQPNGDQSFDVFPDNQRFLMIQPVPESRRELRVMTGVGLPRALPKGP